VVLRRLLKTIQDEEISFKFLGVFRRKNNGKRDENVRVHTRWVASCALVHGTALVTVTP